MFRVIVAFCALHHALGSFPNFYPRFPAEPLGEDPGPPLILTPLIEQNKIQEAQQASQVHFAGFKNQLSYAGRWWSQCISKHTVQTCLLISGYFTVDKSWGSNMFFWYFPARSSPETAPVLLWLQGGPGASSLIGLFAENGPFTVKAKKGLKERRFSWTENHHVIYIDNPVGAWEELSANLTIQRCHLSQQTDLETTHS